MGYDVIFFVLSLYSYAWFTLIPFSLAQFNAVTKDLFVRFGIESCFGNVRIFVMVRALNVIRIIKSSEVMMAGAFFDLW